MELLDALLLLDSCIASAEFLRGLPGGMLHAGW